MEDRVYDAASQRSTPARPARIVIADPHWLDRMGLVQLISESERGNVVAEATNVRDAVAACLATRPDVLVAEARFADGDVALLVSELQRELAQDAPRVFVLSSDLRTEIVYRALSGRARGYVDKGSSRQVIRAALEGVIAGERAILGAAIDALASRVSTPALTAREVRVLELVASGQRTRAIANALGIRPTTVAAHLARLYRKLEVRNRTSAVAAAEQRGLISSLRAPIAPN